MADRDVTDKDNQDAIQDSNDFPGLTAHSGTAGTAEVIRLVSDRQGRLLTGGTVSVDLVETTDFNGGTVSIGTTAVEMTFTGVTQSIMITADYDNAGTIYVGGSLVSSVGSAALTQLVAGEAVTLDFNDGTAPLYSIASAAAQKAFKAALT